MCVQVMAFLAGQPSYGRWKDDLVYGHPQPPTPDNRAGQGRIGAAPYLSEETPLPFPEKKGRFPRVPVPPPLATVLINKSQPTSLPQPRASFPACSCFPSLGQAVVVRGTLTPRTCECVTLCGRRDFADAIKARISGSRGNQPGLSSWAPCNHTVLLSGRLEASTSVSTSEKVM